MRQVKQGRIFLLFILSLGFFLVLALTLFRISVGDTGGLAFIAVFLLFPVIIWVLVGYSENVMDNLKTWIHNTPKKRGTLVFSIIFWYIGLASIISYSMFENLINNLTVVTIMGFLLGYMLHKTLVKYL